MTIFHKAIIFIYLSLLASAKRLSYSWEQLWFRVKQTIICVCVLWRCGYWQVNGRRSLGRRARIVLKQSTAIALLPKTLIPLTFAKAYRIQCLCSTLLSLIYYAKTFLCMLAAILINHVRETLICLKISFDTFSVDYFIVVGKPWNELLFLCTNYCSEWRCSEIGCELIRGVSVQCAEMLAYQAATGKE